MYISLNCLTFFQLLLRFVKSSLFTLIHHKQALIVRVNNRVWDTQAMYIFRLVTHTSVYDCLTKVKCQMPVNQAVAKYPYSYDLYKTTTTLHEETVNVTSTDWSFLQLFIINYNIVHLTRPLPCRLLLFIHSFYGLISICGRS